MGGSNVSKLATGNASGNVGFDGGPRTLSAGGENYGIEGRDLGWAADTAARLGAPLANPVRGVAQAPAEPAYDSRHASANFMQSGARFGSPGSNLVRATTEGGHKFVVHNASAPAFKGFIEELESKVAPLGEMYGYANRTQDSGAPSQHAMGNAMDIFSQEGRDVISREGRQWIETHPKEWRGALDKWGIVSGGDWRGGRGPDLGHIEWSGKKPWVGQQIAAPPKPGSAEYWASTKTKPNTKQVAKAETAKPGRAGYWNSTRARSTEVASRSGPRGVRGAANRGGAHGAHGDTGDFPQDGGAGDLADAYATETEVDFFDDSVSDVHIEINVPIRFY